MLELREVKLQQHFTEAPQHLSESELLELMDRHGIGTLVVGGWGCCSRGRSFLSEKTMVKTKKFPFPPQLLLLQTWGGEEEDWVLLVGFLRMSWMWGLEIFGGTKDGLEFFSFVFVGPLIWTKIDFGQIRPKMYANTWNHST